MKRCSQIILLIALLSVLQRPGLATTGSLRATAAFERADFAQAQELWAARLSAEGPSAAIYYNLASTAYREKKIGRAILYLERARRIAPRDTDIRFNLALIQQYRVDHADAQTVSLRSLLRPVLDYFTLFELWLFYLLIGLPLAAAWAWGYLAAPKQLELLRGYRLRLALLLALAAFPLLYKYSWQYYNPEAIVIVRQVDVQSGPNSQAYATIFTLHAGTRVIVRSLRDGWSQITLPNGMTGWLEAAAISNI